MISMWLALILSNGMPGHGRKSKTFEVDPEGVTGLLGSGAPDGAAERRHKRDGSRDNNRRGYDGEQCR
jgi:hypothetical protein